MKDLLTRALDAHGGLSRWQEIVAFQLKASTNKLLTADKEEPCPLQPRPSNHIRWTTSSGVR